MEFLTISRLLIWASADNSNIRSIALSTGLDLNFFIIDGPLTTRYCLHDDLQY
jgi:hypothetical protein